MTPLVPGRGHSIHQEIGHSNDELVERFRRDGRLPIKREHHESVHHRPRSDCYGVRIALSNNSALLKRRDSATQQIEYRPGRSAELRVIIVRQDLRAEHHAVLGRMLVGESNVLDRELPESAGRVPVVVGVFELRALALRGSPPPT